MDALAVILARDRSVLRPLAGRPLLAHTIERARGARGIARVVVVCDHEDVARLAEALGCEAVDDKGMSAGSLSTARALDIAVDALSERHGFAAQASVVLDPEFPLRTSHSLDAALEHLFRCGADTLVSVHPLTERLWVQSDGGAAERLEGPADQRRYIENDAIVVVRMGAVEPGADLPAGRVVLFDIPPLEAFRVRDDGDFAAAEALVRSALDARSAAILRPIRLLALDFDGVMTDNRVLVLEDGREAVICSRGDGFGLERLRAQGLPVVVISKEGNPVVSARCRKLKIPVEQGIGDKLPVLTRIAVEHGVALSEVAFMGNDLNDLQCMTACGVAIAPCDAEAEVLRIATIVTRAPGGIGAVREVCETLIAATRAADAAPGDADEAAPAAAEPRQQPMT